MLGRQDFDFFSNDSNRLCSRTIFWHLKELKGKRESRISCCNIDSDFNVSNSHEGEKANVKNE